MVEIKYNLEQITKRIEEACARTDRNPNSVTIIAVTKAVSVGRTKEAVDAGLMNLGENRPDGLKLKSDDIDSVKWHFIGSLQSRKVKEVIDQIDYLHSLDRISLAKEIQKRATRKVDCFVQVNVSGEDSKHGLAPDEVISFIQSLEEFDKIRIVGLMTMAPNTENESVLRSVFRELKSLQEDVAALNLVHAPCTECSMGMSNDYVIAVEEGATFVRIGTALVGDESGESR
ncbi:YggS family pyridoxal phosphate-dependent enzyme [Chungangia koreensis]|uniref:Pyridoxal phosphate homeostasis protein n=1 Tax=Chungangia koreensis TaxID=752657 RepID=A0ABV8X1S2_9LACT